MDKSLENLRKEFQRLRTGRASVSLLEPVIMEMPMAVSPLNQVSKYSRSRI